MNLSMGIGLMACAGFIFLALVAGAVVLIIYLTRRSTGQESINPPAAGTPANPLSIAQERYASGAISREEYQQIVNDLNQK
jgi:uncharacterized membrane protein